MAKIEKQEFVAWQTRIEPEWLPDLQNLLASFHRWNGGGYQFLTAEQANEWVREKKLFAQYENKPYDSIVAVCKTDYAVCETGLGQSTPHQRMCDMVEAYGRGWNAAKKSMV